MTSKIWIAAKPIGGIDSDHGHLYLVYDPDGDPTSGDEEVFRGGPSVLGATGNIKIEDWQAISLSQDKLNGADPYTDRDYTLLNTGGQTAEEFKASLSTWASNFGDDYDANGNIITTVPYTWPDVVSQPWAAPALNSNTTIASALASQGIDWSTVTPFAGGDPLSNRLDPLRFPGAESVILPGDGDLTLSNNHNQIVMNTVGENNYTLNYDPLQHTHITIVEDTNPGTFSTLDTLTINGINPEDVHLVKAPNGDLLVYMPGDTLGNPTITIKDQFGDDGSRVNTIKFIPPPSPGDPSPTPTTPEPLTDPDTFPMSPVTPPSGPMDSLEHDFTSGSIAGCPLVLDISGDGIGLSTLGGANNVYWDIASEGVRHASAWTTGGTGLLAIDLNANGRIDDNSELFGSQPAGGAANGFQALATYDSNSDGVIDATDTQFGDLRVWVDTNADGISQTSELHTLSDLNITSINLGYTSVSYQINGNDIKQESTFVMNGETRAIVDAWLQYSSMNTVYGGDYTFDPHLLGMPQQRGYGLLPDLTTVMAGDSTLADMVADIATKTPRELFTESFDLTGKLQALLYEWGGVTGNATNTWPYNSDTADTRRIDFLEEITDRPLTDLNPVHIGYTWDLAVGIIGGDILLQSSLKDLFGDPVYNPLTDTFAGGILPEGDTVFRFIPLEDYATNIWNSTFNDVYVVTPGDMAAGAHTIMEQLNGGTDTLLIGGVDKEDVHLWTDGSGNLVVQYTSTDQITLGGGLAVNGASTVSDHVERIMFDDGTLWDLTQGLKLIDDDTGRMLNGSNHDDTLLGGTGSNYIYGDDGNDTLSGGGGTDHLYGNAGNDTYLFSETTTATTTNVSEAAGEGTDTIRVDGNTGDVAFWIDSSGGHLVLDSTHEMLIATSNSSGVDLGSRIEHIVFNDATDWDFTSGLYENDNGDSHELDGSAGNDVLRGNGGNDYLYDYAGNDTLDGGDGTNMLHGGTGNDTYLFSDTGGTTADRVIEATGEGTDTIRVDGNAGDVRFWVDGSGGHLVFDSNHQMQIDTSTSGGVDLGSRIEHIVFNDATDWDFTAGLYENDTDDSHELDGSTGDDVLRGNGGNDWLYDYAGNDTLDGGDGTNTLHGGTGDDIYLFSAAGGTTADTVQETAGEGDDSIRIDANAADTAFWVDGSGVGHIVLDSSHEMLIQGSISSAADLGSRVEHLVFNDTSYDLTSGLVESDTDDGHELDGSDGDDVMHGNGGNDVLWSYAGDDTLDGGTGSNTLHGGAGDDTYLFSAAGGSTTDSVQETAGQGDDTIRVDANAADAAFWVDGSGVGHIVLDSTHEMLIQGSYSSGGADLGSRIEHLVFNDTSRDLTASLIESDTDDSHELDGSAGDDVLRGNGGNDDLWGYVGNDTLAGGDGLDHLHGGSGADTFVFDHVTAYNNVDVVVDFSVSDGDKLDLRDLLASYDPMTDVLSDFVKVEDDAAGGTAVSIDQDGTGTGHDWVQIATLSGVTGLDADTLASTGHLLAA